MRDCRARVNAAEHALELVTDAVSTGQPWKVETTERHLIATLLGVALERQSADLESTEEEILATADRIPRLRALRALLDPSLVFTRPTELMSYRNRIAFRSSTRTLALAVAALALAPALLASSAHAASVPLGTADSFAVLAATTVTNTGPTVIGGDVGVSPGTAITGFPPGVVSAPGTMHSADGVALQAQRDVDTAYSDAAGRSSTATISADLAGRTLTPGAYTSASSLGLNGDLTLDGENDPNAVFVFQAGSTLLAGTTSPSRVLLTRGAQACNVFWQVGSSATIGPATQFVGNILALTSIALQSAATLNGRALAREAAVTLDSNTITKTSCATASGDAPTGGGTSTGGGGSTGADTSSGDGASTGGGGSTGGDTSSGGGGSPRGDLIGGGGSTGGDTSTRRGNPASAGAGDASTGGGETSSRRGRQTPTGGSDTATGGSDGVTATDSPKLPFTGLNAVWVLLAGGLLIVAGASMRVLSRILRQDG